MVHKDVLAQMALPMIGHRSKDASELQHRISDKMRALMYTSGKIVLSTSSGTGLMEGAIRNATAKRAIVFSIGAFGDRWHELAKFNGIESDIHREEDVSPLCPFLGKQSYRVSHHPVIDISNEAETLCRGVGTKLPHSWVVTTVGDACKGTLAGSVQQGQMILNLRLTAHPTDLTRDVLTVDIARGATRLAHATLAGSAVRSGWMNFPVAYTQDASAPLTVTVHSDGNGRVEIDYLEIFPAAFQIVIGPGSSEVKDSTMRSSAVAGRRRDEPRTVN